nr:cyclin P3-3 [Crypthecodinium cohnii]
MGPECHEKKVEDREEENRMDEVRTERREAFGMCTAVAAKGTRTAAGREGEIKTAGFPTLLSQVADSQLPGQVAEDVCKVPERCPGSEATSNSSTIAGSAGGTFRGDQLTATLGQLLRDISSVGDAAPPSPPQGHLPAGVFTVRSVPTIPIDQYVVRLMDGFQCPISCLLVAFLHMMRIAQKHSVTISSRNVHRLAAATVLVSTKFLQDQPYKNAYYAKVAGMKLKDFNELEVMTLRCMDFKVWIDAEEVADFKRDLLKSSG